jgi:hypothetical protein
MEFYFIHELHSSRGKQCGGGMKHESKQVTTKNRMISPFEALLDFGWIIALLIADRFEAT